MAIDYLRRAARAAKKLYYRWFKEPYDIVRNVNDASHDKNCLILYTTSPFRTKTAHFAHQNQWQVIKLAELVGEFGYNVDVINFDNSAVRLDKQYDLVFDLHPGVNSTYKNSLAPGCKRIVYMTGSNPAVANEAEQQRVQAAEARRGVRLQPRRQAPLLSKPDVESFDGFFFIGNRHNLTTFQDFQLPPTYMIKNTGYRFLAELDSSGRSPKNFLFLAGLGQVHKGLDLLLEIFARHPDLHLYVCSTFSQEPDFCEAYRQELFQTPNIHAIGFVDIASERFREVASRCGYAVMPSCAEGMAGSVLTGMSAGLVPVVSRECGFEDDEVFHFESCEAEYLESTIVSFAQREASWLEAQGRRTIEVVRTRYDEAAFVESVRNGLRGVLGPTPARASRMETK